MDQTQPAPDQPVNSTRASDAVAHAASTDASSPNTNTEEQHERLSPSSGAIQEQTDSPNLPPHLRDTVTRVPVTPEFGNGENDEDPGPLGDSQPTNPLKLRSGSLSSGPVTAATVKALKQSKSGVNLLRKAVENNADMATRRESLSDIRASNPDLALSGNIISATFNIPHSLDYRKGADWVSYIRHGESALRSRSVKAVYLASNLTSN